MNNAPIQGIRPLWDTLPLVEHEAARSTSSAQSLFADIFGSAIDGVRQSDDEKNRVQYALATGQLDNPAESTMASTKYAMSVDLLIQLRNKALDAYSELSRISL